jgi:hypothetical protein
MAKSISEEIFEDVLARAADKLTAHGFVQRGPVFRLVRQGNCGIIAFQRSDTSTNDRVIFTINLGIVCGELLGSGSAAVVKANIIDAHMRQRIGQFLPDRPDKWWEASADRVPVAQEIVELLTRVGVPYVESYITTEALIALWESGQSPGLTEVQRGRYLAILKPLRPR